MAEIRDTLQNLADLQKIDSKLDRIHQVRGGLPEEVRDLEDELAGIQGRLNRIQEEVDEANSEISEKQRIIAESEASIKKYDRQMSDVKNNREYEALQKEIELAKLEIMTAERKINQFGAFISEREEKIEKEQQYYNERTEDLEAKKKELENIIEETEADERRLQKDSEKAQKKIEDRLLKAYQRIRHNMRNGLAVVTLDREACGGCFSIIPPQKQFEIRQKKSLITCENCGRILVDHSFFKSKEAQEEAATAS